jgi:hypothetical protein
MIELYILACLPVFLLAIWLYPSRNYKTCAEASAVFLSVAQCDDFQVVYSGVHDAAVRCRLGELTFWNANRWYAWANSGAFTPTGAERPSVIWRDRMPSRKASRIMRKRMESAITAGVNGDAA